jgi:hypothetical protein
VPGGTGEAGGSGGALRRCSSVLSASARRPMPRTRAAIRGRDTRLGFGRPGAQLLLDLSRHGEAAHLLLGEEHLVTDGDFKDSPGATHELGLDAEFLLEIGRQTGGTGVVVSHPAVFDSHVGHGCSPFPGQFYDSASRASVYSLLQVLDHLWIRVLKIGMKVPWPMLGTIGARSRGKRDKDQTFPWKLRMTRSTIEIVQPSLSWETGTNGGEQ